MFKEINKDGLRHQEKMSERIKNWVVETDADKIRTIIIKITMPTMISNRSMFTNIYHYVKKDGSYCAIQSSRGTEYCDEKYADEVNGDVICWQNMAMTKFIPFEGGCEVH